MSLRPPQAWQGMCDSVTPRAPLPTTLYLWAIRLRKGEGTFGPQKLPIQRAIRSTYSVCCSIRNRPQSTVSVLIKSFLAPIFARP